MSDESPFTLEQQVDLLSAHIRDLRSNLHNLQQRQAMMESGWQKVGYPCATCFNESTGESPIGGIWERDDERQCHRKGCDGTQTLQEQDDEQ